VLVQGGGRKGKRNGREWKGRAVVKVMNRVEGRGEERRRRGEEDHSGEENSLQW